MRFSILTIVFFGFITGCTSIVNDLTTEPIQSEETGKTIGAGIDDPKMRTFIGVNIKKADPALDKAHINVSVFNGLVLLTGEVPNGSLRMMAGDIARGYRGVRKVYNELQVRGNTSIMSRTNDSLISTKIKTKLTFNPEIDYSDMLVVTEDSIVYLLGTVDQASADLATEIAAATGGVRKIVKCLEYVD
jgi:osmotically-inducible protein OsmY